MARLVSSSGTLAVTGDAELVEGPYDVRDTSFAPAGYIVFSARVGGQTSIYKVLPGGTPSILVSGKEEVESGAVSPNGQWIVFRELLGNRWQLVRMDLANRQERQLTFGDCNAFAPAWMNATTVGYGTDCGRGLGLPALASIDVGR